MILIPSPFVKITASLTESTGPRLRAGVRLSAGGLNILKNSPAATGKEATGKVSFCYDPEQNKDERLAGIYQVFSEL